MAETFCVCKNCNRQSAGKGKVYSVGFAIEHLCPKELIKWKKGKWLK